MSDLTTVHKIRLSTFNVYYGKNPDKIVEQIRSNKNLQSTDVILLQEIEAHPHENLERAKIIAEGLGMQYVYAPARAAKLGTHGLALLSKFPIKEYEIVTLPFYRLAFKSRPRIALNVVLEIGAKELLISNVHLDLRINIKDRIDQTDALITWINQHKVKNVVIAGDFNTVPLYWAGRAVPVFYANQRKQLHRFLEQRGFNTCLGDIGYTMHQKIIKFSLDSVFTRGVEIGDFGVERAIRVSDHKPVWVDLLV